ncbi:MAG: type II toxin-antitoxin system RelE/ParE family toxin [Phascolarctobacterium sp.]
MDFKIIISENAARQLENILDYLIYRLHSPQAASNVLNEIEAAYTQMQYMADSMPYCQDRYLLSKGYRKWPLSKHDYVLLYQVKGNVVYVNGVFHMLENYRMKL